MCRVLEVHLSGFYTWLDKPESKRSQEDVRLLGQVKQYWIESGIAYGYRNITKDLKEGGERCGKNRVYRIMKAVGIRSQCGYKRYPGFKGGMVRSVIWLPIRWVGYLKLIGPIRSGSLTLPISEPMRVGYTLRLFWIIFRDRLKGGV